MGTKNDEDPFNKIVKTLDMVPISTRKLEWNFGGYGGYVGRHGEGLDEKQMNSKARAAQWIQIKKSRSSMDSIKQIAQPMN